MAKRFAIQGARPDDRLDHARREMMHSLLDGRALWPDGTPRNGSAVAVMKDEVRAPTPCEVSEALGVAHD